MSDTPFNGSVTVIKATPITPTPGSAINIGNQSRTFSWSFGYGEKSAGYRANPFAKLPGEAEGTFEIEAVETTASVYGVAALQPTAAGTTFTLEVWPRGETTGAPKRAMPALLLKREENSPYDDVYILKISGSITDEPTFSTVA